MATVIDTAAPTVVPPDPESAGRRSGAVPQRAEGVQLIGEMPGTGYRDAPALVRRCDGQLIKLTPLLYSLVESIDGNRGLDALAAVLSRRVGKHATAGDVRYLVEHKLRPLGLLRGADGAQPETKRANPLLALRLRIILSRPGLTRRLAAPFVWLFSPVVVVPMVAAFAATIWWLVAHQGLTAALHQAFYEPVMILVIWGLVIVSAAFHEIGHAAACRYGGARPGVMGAGLYLVWPVFYTEVSDAYRLNRRARLRVDLGGLYFSAIFAVGTVALWAATGHDAVLLVIAAQVLQMVRQLAPFIRADGYHILADLTGIPDLFAQIKPTLLGLLPTRWGRPQNQALKPWARLVVRAWVLVVVPLLLAILGYIVLLLPRLAATAWDSMGRQWASAEVAWGAGDPAGVVVGVVSAGLVALPILGIVYLLSRIIRRTAVRTWAATAGRPRMRGAAVAGAVAAAGLLAWAWWPGDEYQPIAPNEPGPVPSVRPAVTDDLTLQPLWFTRATAERAPRPLAFLVPAHAGEGGHPQSPLPDRLGNGPAANDHRGDPHAPAIEPDPDAPPASPLPAPIGADQQPSSDQQLSADEEHSLAWPFPFDPPGSPGPGDNRAMAVNTTDGSVLWALAVSLLLLTGDDPVAQSNEAYALASCTACRTVAVAFQVIVIVGYVDQIMPLNAAVAVNYQCVLCTTAAFAYQVTVTLMEMPSDEVKLQIATALQRLMDLEGQLGSLALGELYLALEGVQQDVLAALTGAQGVEAGESVSTTLTEDTDDAARPPSAEDMAGEGGTETTVDEAVPPTPSLDSTSDPSLSDPEAATIEEPVGSVAPEEPAPETPTAEDSESPSVDDPEADPTPSEGSTEAPASEP